MKFSFDKKVIEIPCPACRKKIKKQFAWFDKDGHTCPYCGARLKFDEFAKALKSIKKNFPKIGD